MATVSDEEGQPFLTGSVLLLPRSATELDPRLWGFRATQQNRGLSGVAYYDIERILPGSYLVVAIDIEPFRLTADTELMERARVAAIPVEIHEGQTLLALRLVRLRAFVQAPSEIH